MGSPQVSTACIGLEPYQYAASFNRPPKYKGLERSRSLLPQRPLRAGSRHPNRNNLAVFCFVATAGNKNPQR